MPEKIDSEDLREAWWVRLVLNDGAGPLGKMARIQESIPNYPIRATEAAILFAERLVDLGEGPETPGESVVLPLAVENAPGDWRAFSVRVVMEPQYSAWEGEPGSIKPEWLSAAPSR